MVKRPRTAEIPIELSRAEVLAGITRSRAEVVDLLRSLSSAEWTSPSRCAGWTVNDVAGHLTGLFADVAVGRMAGQGRPETTARQAAERHGRTPGQVADELARAGRLCDRVLDTFSEQAWHRPAPGGFPGPLRRAVLVLWYELYVHGDDIRCGAGRAAIAGPGLRASVVHVAETLGRWGWGPATLRLPGVEDLPVRGGGPVIEADTRQFLLAATGRADPAPLGLDERVNIYR